MTTGTVGTSRDGQRLADHDGGHDAGHDAGHGGPGRAPTVAGVEQVRRLVTEVPGPVSRRLRERRDAVLPTGVGLTLPAFVARAGGSVLVDVDGNQLLDLGAGIAVVNAGHAHPRVVEAVQAQAASFLHTCFMVTPYEAYVAVAERLGELAPVDGPTKTVLLNSGAEAVENAVKVARHATGRDAVVVFDHAYHGRTNLTMAMTAKAMPYKRGFGPFAGEVYRVPMSYPFRDPEGMTGEQAAERAVRSITTQVGADQVACVVIEPVQGEGGFVEPAPGFLPALAAWCRDNGVLFVADEIQTGFGRTGDVFALDHEGVRADLVTVAKGLADGMPLAGVVGRAGLMDAVHPGGLGGTYGGNPVACAAALAAMDVLVDEDLAGRARWVGSVARPVLERAQAEHPSIGEVRGRGAMLALEFVRPGTTEPDAAEAARVAAACHAAGVVVLTCGTYGNVIRLLPPLVITEDLLRDGLDVLVGALGGAA
ncbi:4-aminobutyrate--2-oxoglutarate transaminase [Aquipuribacter hungaricus]|uniref:(S)-3-amino-2-methylpropionate transaminase n=1 Tax=Aquipuribacter hungaricus TaxID=545624 RepID=A0ABV7WGI8_9MICO